MKFIEYLYLILMIMSLVFLAMEYDSLQREGMVWPFVVATGLFAFMFTFRRRQRIQMEKYMEKHVYGNDEEEEDEEELENNR